MEDINSKLTVFLQDKFYKDLHRRIAQAAVGASAIRNQGKKGDTGLIKNCRQYFEHSIDLMNFFTALSSERDFEEFLDNHTDAILSGFPETAKSWGAARKGLNLFFRDVIYNKYFADKFGLPSDFHTNNEKIGNLEVPLDKDVALGLRKQFKRDLPKWQGIKHLTPSISKLYQDKAKELADLKDTARVHLDLEFWRIK